MLYVIILCVIIIGFLGYKLNQKQFIDRSEKNKLDLEVASLKQKRDTVEQDIERLNKKSDEAIERYNNSVRDKSEELENYLLAQKRQRQFVMDQDMEAREKTLEENFENKKKYYNTLLENTKQDCDNQCELVKQASEEIINKLQDDIKMYQREVKREEERWTSTIQSSRLYEKDKQARLFYTIQLPEEFREDIEFLLTTVAAKVQHPDIISKLVWAEYVKPYLDDTFKRIEIKPEPGIYKLTSLINNKCYVGKSTNVKTRITDHFKSTVGIKSIADQAVHHAILKEGFWNWQIEVITYCEKDRLSELEKYYIEFFKAQEYGYNKTGGG